MARQAPVHPARRLKPDAAALRVGLVPFLALALGGVSACAQGTSPNYGQDFGRISLQAGQAQQVWIGPSYRLLWVCNDFSSAGTVVAVIDGQPATTLPPGRCDEDYGNRIQFTNTGGGSAVVTYRSVVEPFTP